MKYRISAAIILSLGLASCDTSPASLSNQDLSSIRAASAKWVATYNRNDWASLSELFTPDAVMMPPNSLEVAGRSAIAAWEGKYEDGFRIAFDIQEISGIGGIAYVKGRSCVFIPSGDGSYGVDVGKFFEVRKKQPNGEWLITHDIFNSDIAAGSELREACPFANAEEL